MKVDLVFPALGHQLPVDHGYILYAALCNACQPLHDATDVLISPISGGYAGGGLKQLTAHSALRIRLPAEQIPRVLPLAGKRLTVAGQTVRLGVPQVRPLASPPALMARMVTIKGFVEPDTFLAAARRHLQEREIEGQVSIPQVSSGLRMGEPRRRILRIKSRRIIGFSLLVEGLSAEHSLKLQEEGCGGRLKMGCGFFAPLGKAGLPS